MLLTMISSMKKTLVIFSILIILVIITKSEFSATNDAEIDQLLKKLNKPALKSIKSPDGDIIDCVDMKNHPIYDHPLFKNYTIKMRPSFDPETRNNNVSFNTAKQSSLVTQLWRLHGRCPKNTIPIRRTRREDILRAKSVERYGKKDSKHLHTSNQNVSHEYAVFQVRENVYGARALINVWKPEVQTPGEFSLAQIWICGGPIAQQNCIEAGWQVYPSIYGHSSPQFFSFWTADGYNTYCYNLNCPGFVPVNRDFAVGVKLTAISTLNGNQHDIPIQIWKDNNGDWWLKVYEDIVVGYWPSRLFNHLNNGAERVDWGGEILNVKEGSQHTTTKMGSGHFAQEGFQKASYFKHMEICDDYHRLWRTPTTGYFLVTNANCYNIIHGIHDSWGAYIFYGGPGRNPNCP